MWKKTVNAMVMLSVLVVSPASALVQTWEYQIDAVFTQSAFDGNDYNIVQNDTILKWGTDTGEGRSRLRLIPSSADGQVNTYVGALPDISYWADSIALRHVNNPITGTSLLSTVLRTTVLLDPLDPDNDPLPLQEFTFNIKFVETPNNGPHPSDIFALIGGFPDFTFNYDDGMEARDYYVNLFPSDGSVLIGLTGLAAQLAGVPEGTLGFTTPEDQTTTLPFAFTISTQPLNTPVPEPSTLILLGTGLLGVALLARRKNN
ncbi:THxN family PEP-CTERM protein [Desulfuromonas thiophila]|uniref:THxN family PEP-CTERM protein n=1 Tax=Desulfuromonas thiophila TaxID=57664 RepID=UPI0024A7CCD8|nr:THxN family PEP-CTERM protein [Desulfuromonas thiophila]